MPNIKVDGDVWEVRLGEERPRPGVRLVLFFSRPTGQRPYRVVEVAEKRVASAEDLERLSKRELAKLYEESTSLDIPKLRSDEIMDVRRAPPPRSSAS